MLFVGAFLFIYAPIKLCKDRVFFAKMQGFCSKNMFYGMILLKK